MSKMHSGLSKRQRRSEAEARILLSKQVPFERFRQDAALNCAQMSGFMFKNLQGISYVRTTTKQVMSTGPPK